MRKPNLLFVFSDQHRSEALGCNGNPDVRSPHLDAFAAANLNATHCVSNVPVCVPVRGSMLTGRYALWHGAIANDLPVKPETESIATLMNAAGYATGYIGKWHLGGIPRDQFITAERRLGFTEWKVSNCNHSYMDGDYWDDEANERHPIPGYDAITQTDNAIEFIERHNGAPWGLVLSWAPPHDPYRQVPERYLELYDPEKLQLRGNVRFPVRANNQLSLDETALRQNLQGYYAHISALDEQFGRLLATLEATGQLENTIVVYTSDHGDMLGSHGETQKQWLYDESLLVPLIVSWPGHVKPGVQEGIVSLTDLPVGLMAMLGLSFSGPTEGRDCAAMLSDPSLPGFDYADAMSYVPCHQASARARDGHAWRGLRTQDWSYGRVLNEGVDVGWLYDMKADPLQLNNLYKAPEAAETRAALEAQMVAHAPQAGELVPWEELLKRHGLWDKWVESEEHFAALWKRMF